MTRNFALVAIATALAACSCAALATPVFSNIRGNLVRSSQLPEIQCAKTACTFVQSQNRTRRSRFAPLATPAVANSTPIAVGPPAGQRYIWQGAGYPSCQDISTATGANPYTYMSGTQIPVPLGSTHISLLATMQANLAGGPVGAAGDVGMLQVKPSSGTAWTTVSAGYALTVYGSSAPQNLYGIGTYHALVDLASLNSGTVPSEIDVRVIAFPLYTSGFTNVPDNNVCWGQMELSF